MDTTHNNPVLSDTHLINRKKSSPSAVVIAVLAIALVVTVITGMTKLRDRDTLIANLQTDLTQGKTAQTQLQAQLADARNQTDALGKQLEVTR